MMSVGVYTWLGNGGPTLFNGAKDALAPYAEILPFKQKPPRSYGIIASVPAKGSSRLEFSYFQTSGSDAIPAPQDENFAGTNVLKGDQLTRDYKIAAIKVSWNYLTYPVPSLDAKLRIKTLWEIQYLKLDPVLIGFPVVNPGNVAVYNQTVLYPTAGLGVEYVPSRHFRMEVRGSGFGLPGHSIIWDTEGSLVTRVGPLEIFAGAKAYHFRSSPQKPAYLEDTLWGPTGGLRWVFKNKVR